MRRVLICLPGVFISSSLVVESFSLQGPSCPLSRARSEVVQRTTPTELVKAGGLPTQLSQTTSDWRRDFSVHCKKNEDVGPRVDKNPETSEYSQTSDPVKTLVSGLTNIFVWISGGRDNDVDSAFDQGRSKKEAISLQELEAGIRQEYVKNYLWTGDINEALYEEDCSFTDPTLSFIGLSTYKRNVESLQGILKALVSDSSSILYDLNVRQDESCVETRWRMVGDLRLPWGSTIDVIGRTKFSYDPARGNRIWSYDEVWEVEPATALMQLLKPGRRGRGPVSPAAQAAQADQEEQDV